jgi:hypothetical protein
VNNKPDSNPNLRSRFMHQFDIARAAMSSAAATKAIMDSEIGKLMKAQPTLTFAEALMQVRQKRDEHIKQSEDKNKHETDDES